MSTTKWNWKETAPGQSVQGKSWFTRFVGWINSLFNDNHSWFDYGEMDKSLSSVQNQITHEGLTGAQVAENEMSMQNAEDIFQRQVAGMQKAGLNPALMYENGVSGSSPSAPSQAATGFSMSELMQLVTLPLQRRMLESQIQNVNANTEKQEAETDTEKNRAKSLALANLYYPALQEGKLSELASRVGLNLSTIDSNEAKTAFTWIETSIKEKENEFASKYYEWRAKYEEAKTEEAKANVALKGAETLMASFEYDYAKANGAKLSSSSALAIVSALGNMFSRNMPEVSNAIKDSLKPFGLTPFNMPKSVDNDINDKFQKGKQKVQSFGKRVWSKWERFVNRNFNGFGN